MTTSNLYPLQGIAGRAIDNSLSTKPVDVFSISPLIIKSYLQNDMYIFYFKNMCFNNQPVRDYLRVNQMVLKNKLGSWLKSTDKKYIKLADYNNLESKFVFDIDAWLDDSLKGCKPYTNFLMMSKSYKLSKQLPYMVSVYGLEMSYGKYICDHFKKYLKTHKELRNNVFGIIEDISTKHLHLDSISMFDYTYNRTSNSVVVSVKPIYTAMITAAAYKIKNSLQDNKKVDFDKSVGMFLKFKK